MKKDSSARDVDGTFQLFGEPFRSNGYKVPPKEVTGVLQLLSLKKEG